MFINKSLPKIISLDLLFLIKPEGTFLNNFQKQFPAVHASIH